MKLLSVRLKGFIGISDGMGLGEIEIDLSNVSGLIAFSGQNGRGKTTILEALSPYWEFVSRDSNHLADQVFTRNAEWELNFIYNGDTYKKLIKIDCETRHLEGYLYKNGAKESLVNGKISNYKKYITKLMGSPTLFYNSVFCSQNAPKISDMGETDLRNLFREFVGADKLEELSQTALKVSKDFKFKLENQQLEHAPVSTSIPMTYFTHPLDFGSAANLIFPKQVDVTLIGGLLGDLSLEWGFDYKSPDKLKKLSIGSGTLPSFWTAEDSVPPQPPLGIAEWSDPELNPATTGILGYWTEGQAIHQLKYNIWGSGRNVKVGFSADIQGSTISIQELNIQVLQGRIL